MRKKTVVLTRFSSIMQDNISQKTAIDKYINDNRLIVDEWIEEDAVSGFKTRLEDRKGLMIIKDMALNEELDTLIIFNSDRIGRRMEMVGFMSLMTECKVKVISVTEGVLNGGCDTDDLLNSIRFWTAQQESRKTSKRVKNGKLAKIKQDGYAGGTPNYGYRVVDKKLEINEEESKIVIMLFEEYVIGGIPKIIKIIEKNKITKRGEQFNRQKILKLLHNPIYIGKKQYQGELIDMPQLRIVSDELFYKVQDIMQNRRTKGTTKYVNKTDALLESILWHQCEDGEIRKVHVDYVKLKNGDKRPYYRCKHCKDVKAKITKNYNSNKIEPLVINDIKSIMGNTDIETLEKRYNKEINDSIKGINDTIDIIQRNIEKKNKDIEKAIKQIENIILGESNLDIEIVNGLIQKLKDEKQGLEEVLNINIDELNKLKNKTSKAIYLLQKYKNFDDIYDKSNDLEKKNILQELIDKIIISHDKIYIDFNIY
ncbi:recombinase family protein [Romboutsia timonensis]|uniref:recombinase family protein n=1 Tax=Romboutsia timonensis TaxID=1776391 RepID=UPI0008DA02FA|nr:recombinase family protein [Romboutsia timonensis]